MEEDQKIDTVPEGVQRPLWSVMVPVYNRTKYVRQAVESVLSQDPGDQKMQVCIVDNSTEHVDWPSILSPESLQRVEIYKQPVSVPGHENWNTCIQQSRGQLVHILHDDDWVAKGFYEEVETINSQSLNCGLIALRSFFVDDSGVIQGVTPNLDVDHSISFDITRFVPHNPVQCAGVVVRRSAYEELGGFRGDMNYVIDLEMWVRIISKLGARYSPKVLAYYRTSPENGTNISLASGRNLYEMKAFYAFITREHAEYSVIRREDYYNTLLQLARNQEERFNQNGQRAEAAIAKQFWLEHAPFTLKISRLLRDFFKRVGYFIFPNK